MTLAAFIATWRESHKEGWHDQECCVNELLDELERLDDAKSPVPHGASIKCEFCPAQASFIIKRCAVCYVHRSVPVEHAESMGNK